MSNIIELKKEPTGAEALLKDALEEKFDDIILVGIRENGNVYIRTTYVNDMLKTLGAIEAGKSHILEDW